MFPRVVLTEQTLFHVHAFCSHCARRIVATGVMGETLDVGQLMEKHPPLCPTCQGDPEHVEWVDIATWEAIYATHE